jgi:GPH family glycoside/pentoside/hexuronide:cation symporter
VVASLAVKESALPNEQISPSHKPADNQSLIDGFKCILGNVPFLMVTGIVAFTIIGLSSAMTNNFFLNLAVVCPGDNKTAGELAFVTGVIGAVAGFLITFALPSLSARFGRQRLLLTSLVGMIVAFLASPWLFTAKLPYLQVVFHIIVQMSVTSVWVLTFPMLADVCDYDEVRTGVRREGFYTATYNWGCKVAIAMIGVVSGAILDFSGFNKELALQSERTTEILRWSFALVPLPFFIGCIVLTVLFPLNAQRLQKMREERAHAQRPQRIREEKART